MDSLLQNTTRYFSDLCRAYLASLGNKPEEPVEPARSAGDWGKYADQLQACLIWGLGHNAWIGSLTRVADILSNSKFDSHDQAQVGSCLNIIEQNENPDERIIGFLDQIRQHQGIPIPVRRQV